MLLKTLAIAGLAFLWAWPVPSASAQDGNEYYVVAKKKAKSKPLRGTIYNRRGRRIGGYSYKYSDTIDTRKFNERSVRKQSRAGPFDSGFFFETPRGPFGGTTPYMH